MGHPSGGKVSHQFSQGYETHPGHWARSKPQGKGGVLWAGSMEPAAASMDLGPESVAQGLCTSGHVGWEAEI